MVFKRPDNIPIQFSGLNTDDPPELLKPDKYPIGVNIRSLTGQSVFTRPGSKVYLQADALITDIGTYSTLETDGLPRILARTSGNKIYLDGGSLGAIPQLVATLTGTSNGVSMVPFRPNQSPQTWMYVADRNNHVKLSAPNAADTVINHKVGIREPQSSIEASPMSFGFYAFSGVATDWTRSGTAGVLADATRLSDVATAVFADPASDSTRWSIQVATNKTYQIGMVLSIVKSTGGTYTTIVEDVLPPINTGASITIQSIRYYSGTSGRCVIVPNPMPKSLYTPYFFGNAPVPVSVSSQVSVASLRRGSLISLSGGPEVCMVLSVTSAPDGTTAFEISTTGTHVAGETITGVPAIVVSDISNVVTGQTITSVSITSTLTGPGTGSISRALATNPFAQPLAPSTNIPQPDDYVCFSMSIDNPTLLVEGKIIFDIKNGAADYVTDYYYTRFNKDNIIFSPVTPYEVNTLTLYGSIPVTEDVYRAAEDYARAVITSMANVPYEGQPPEAYQAYLDSLQGQYQRLIDEYINQQTTVATGTVTSLTPVPATPWVVVRVPISSLTRVGSDSSRSLANCQGVRVSVLTSNTVNIAISSFWVGGGGAPDVGVNTPYFYCIRGRSTLTGTRGNLSPNMRYGVSPRRQKVRLEFTDTISDSQVDVFDIFRYGGTVLSWRLLGTIRNTAGTIVYTDDKFDSTLTGSDTPETDNIEPWPSVDYPLSLTAGVSSGVTTTITAYGNVLTVTRSSAAALPDILCTITSWLPGTLIRLGSKSAYTLRSRPTTFTIAPAPDTYYDAYLFEFVESCGYGAVDTIAVLEPNLANQHLPYVWGPNTQGDIFGCGDIYRPGTVSFTKHYNPDSVPTSYNLEIASSSEPLVGGDILNGVCLVASSKRWWSMHPSFDTPQRYWVTDLPIGRGLVSHLAKCNDGKFIYFWVKDGIWRMNGESGESITDPDLSNLFPHGGVEGSNILYHGKTIYAPDYRYSSSFRLGVSNNYLYADYKDSTGTYRTLVYNMLTKAWSVDEYPYPVAIHYGVNQQKSSLASGSTLYPAMLMGNTNFEVLQEFDNTNDRDTTPISSRLATFEFDAGDPRALKKWNDAILSSKPLSGLSVTPVSNGVSIGAATVISASSTRVNSIISIAAEALFCGLDISWTDDFSLITEPTELRSWQPLVEPLPISMTGWAPEGMGFGIDGYKTIYKILAAYKSNADIQLAITTYDGYNPVPVTLPSTGGAYQKRLITLTPNKGLLFFFSVPNGSEWTPYLDEWEIHVAKWDRQQESCSIVKTLTEPDGEGR